MNFTRMKTMHTDARSAAEVHIYILSLYTHINLYIYILYVHKFIHTSMERLENLLNDNAHYPLLDYGLCRVPSTATTIWRL